MKRDISLFLFNRRVKSVCRVATSNRLCREKSRNFSCFLSLPCNHTQQSPLLRMRQHKMLRRGSSIQSTSRSVGGNSPPEEWLGGWGEAPYGKEVFRRGAKVQERGVPQQLFLSPSVRRSQSTSLCVTSQCLCDRIIRAPLGLASLASLGACACRACANRTYHARRCLPICNARRRTIRRRIGGMAAQVLEPPMVRARFSSLPEKISR